jgi:hypothetical protein
LRVEGGGGTAIELFRLLLGQQLSFRRKQRIEFERAEKCVEAQVHSDERCKFDDLIVAIVLSKFIEERSVYCVGAGTHKLAIAEGDLLGFGIAVAVSVILNAFVEQLF